MGFLSWLWSLFSGGGSKDIGALEEDEAKLESKKSQLRIIEDKLRAKEAQIEREESKTVREELGEVENISRGESPKAERKDVMKLVIGDEKIRKKLRKKKRLTSKVGKIGKIIEKIDRKEGGKEVQITRKTGRPSSRTAQLQQDTQVQGRIIQSEKREKYRDTQLLKCYKEKEECEKKLLKIEHEMSKIFPDEKSFETIEATGSDDILVRRRWREYYSLRNEKRHLENKIRIAIHWINHFERER